MLKKKVTWIVIIIILLVLSMALKMSNAEDVAVKEEIAKNVKVMAVEENIYHKNAKYIGVVQPSNVQKYSHKYGGTIKSINVSEGQKVSKDEVLIVFDAIDFKSSLQASKNNLAIAKANYEKALKGAKNKELAILDGKLNLAVESFELSERLNGDSQKLYSAGAISKLEYDKSELDLVNKRMTVNEIENRIGLMKDGATTEELVVLKSLYNQAEIDCALKVNIYDQRELKVKKEGYIISLLCEEDENTGAGIPLIVVGSNTTKVAIGVTQKEINKIKIGKQCTVEIEDEGYGGVVTLVNKSPDIETMTYLVEIQLDTISDDIYPGILGRVSISTGSQNGVAIPISALLSDGEDYVYIMNNYRAKRVNVEVVDIIEDEVIVQGLIEDQVLITEGMKGLKNGYRVSIMNTVE